MVRRAVLSGIRRRFDSDFPCRFRHCAERLFLTKNAG